jgi:6-phospho-beta-glucosidase
LKIGILGGSGVYTPALITEIIKSNGELDVDQIVLNGRSSDKLNIVKNVCRELVRRSGLDIKIDASTNIADAVKDMDVVISQVRIGGMQARAFDEKFPPEFNMVGEETIGPGGLSNAIRTIPAVLEISSEVERCNKNAFLIMLTNPCSMILRAINQAKYNIKAVGICDLPRVLISKIADLLKIGEEELDVEYFGLNHLGWIKKVYHNGIDLTDNVIDRFDEIDGIIEKDIVQFHKAIPVSHLKYYFHPDRILNKPQTRAHELLSLEEEILGNFKSGNLKQGLNLLNRRSTVWYKYIIDFIKTIYRDKQTFHILNVKNDGIMNFLPTDSVVETGCIVRRGEIRPLPVKDIPLSIQSLITQINTYEELAVQGILQNSRALLIEALMVHPFIRSYDQAEAVLNKIIKGNIEMGFLREEQIN